MSCGIPIVGIQIVTFLRGNDSAGVLDRTPILLSAATDFTSITEDAVAIRTISAVYFLDRVQIVR